MGSCGDGLREAREACSFCTVLTIALVTLIMFGCSGPVFGLNALQPVLVAEGVFADRCPNATLPVGGDNRGTAAENNPANTCTDRSVLLASLMSTAFGIANGCGVLVGATLDALGRRRAAVLSLVVGLGSVMLLAFAPVNSYPAWAAGFTINSLSGFLFFLSCMTLTGDFNDSPRLKAFLNLLFTSIFDLSAFIFVIVADLYFSEHLSLRWIFIVYGLVVNAGGTLLVFILFRKPLQTASTAAATTPAPPINDNPDEKTKPSAKQAVLQLLRALRSPPVLLVVAAQALNTFYGYFYISTIWHQITWSAGEGAAGELMHWFNLALPLMGLPNLIIGTVVIGNTTGSRARWRYAFLFLMGVAWTVTSVIPRAAAQWFTIFAFAIWRVQGFSILYATVGDCWGATGMFGSLTGGSLTVGGLLSLVSPGINQLVLTSSLNGAPAATNLSTAVATGSGYLLANLILGGVCMAVSAAAFIALSPARIDASLAQLEYRPVREEDGAK